MSNLIFSFFYDLNREAVKRENEDIGNKVRAFWVFIQGISRAMLLLVA